MGWETQLLRGCGTRRKETLEDRSEPRRGPPSAALNQTVPHLVCFYEQGRGRGRSEDWQYR